MQHYLGPDRRLVVLDTWDDIEHAASEGLLDENQWCELKVKLDAGKPSQHRTGP